MSRCDLRVFPRCRRALRGAFSVGAEAHAPKAPVWHAQCEQRTVQPVGMTEAEAAMTKGKPCLPSRGNGLYPLGGEVPLNYTDLRISVEGKGQPCILERSQWE